MRVLVFVVGPWAVGQLLRQRSASTEEAVSRAARLEREQELRTSLAAAAERTRIARELHDIVSHSISVVTIQTQAVRRRLGPEHAAEAADLAAVEATAREALAEMRRLFGVLRADGETVSLAPQPGARRARSARVPARRRRPGCGRLEVEGEPSDLPPGLDLAAYRIAQEGLTNAVRHSGARTAWVRLRLRRPASRRGGRGRRQRAGAARSGIGANGHGLVGIRERVALYGGTLEVTDRSGGGVRLVGAACRWGRRAMTSLVIVDDQGMVRAGFRSLLSGEPDLDVVGEAAERRAGRRGWSPGCGPTSR